MTRNTSFFFLTLSVLLAVSLLIGCGGGGGDGDNPVNPIGGGYTWVGDLGETPTGFVSGFFPVPQNQSTLVVENFTADRQATVILANNSLNALTVQVTANVAAPVVNLVHRSHEPEQLLVSEQKFSPGAALSARLREKARSLPSFKSIPPASLQNKSIRKDAANVPVTFKIYDTGKTVTALLQTQVNLGSGKFANFFLDQDQVGVVEIQQRINEYAAAFPVIYNQVRSVFGEEPPADFNSLGADLTILVSNQIADSELIAGLFYEGDLYPASVVPSSNVRKMFYLSSNLNSSNELVLSETTMISTLAHEFQHMVNFYQRKKNDLSEETWLNEAMSGYSEHVCGFSITTNNGSKCAQVQDFLQKASGTELLLWNPNFGGTDAQYGQAYLFGTWLAQHYGRTVSAQTGVVKDLLTSPSVGVTAVTNFCGEGFDKVFSRFVTALYVNDFSGNSKYGFVGINLQNTYRFSDYEDVVLTGPSLYSGAASGYNSGGITIQPYSSAYVVLSGGNGETLSIAVPTNLTVLELTK